MSRAPKILSLLVISTLCGTFGFFLRDYLRLREEVEGLRLMAGNAIEMSNISLDISNQTTVTTSACLKTLSECTEMVEKLSPMPRHYAGLQAGSR